jgi:hypothetical protein
MVVLPSAMAGSLHLGEAFNKNISPLDRSSGKEKEFHFICNTFFGMTDDLINQII